MYKYFLMLALGSALCSPAFAGFTDEVEPLMNEGRLGGARLAAAQQANACHWMLTGADVDQRLQAYIEETRELPALLTTLRADYDELAWLCEGKTLNRDVPELGEVMTDFDRIHAVTDAIRTQEEVLINFYGLRIKSDGVGLTRQEEVMNFQVQQEEILQDALLRQSNARREAFFQQQQVVQDEAAAAAAAAEDEHPDLAPVAVRVHAEPVAAAAAAEDERDELQRMRDARLQHFAAQQAEAQGHGAAAYRKESDSSDGEELSTGESTTSEEEDGSSSDED